MSLLGQTERGYAQAELLPLSGLQHLVFCERQCALIHIERVWAENALTAEGKILHERVDLKAAETRAERRVLRSVQLRSLELGLVGKADVVELRLWSEARDPSERAFIMPGIPGAWMPVPVEYKRGRPKRGDFDRIQVCAQAMCLEEMLGVSIPQGELFYGSPRRRTLVELDDALRSATGLAAQRFHELVQSGRTPLAARQPKCRSCSLIGICLPPRRRHRPVAAYLAKEAPDLVIEHGDWEGAE
jgi:CRISPR-associated exonuclease Cas4